MTAIANAQKATELKPENPHSWVARAIAPWENSDTVAAQQAYQQAIALDAIYRKAGHFNYLQEARISSTMIVLQYVVCAFLDRKWCRHVDATSKILFRLSKYFTA